jgi:hypothetical protein
MTISVAAFRLSGICIVYGLITSAGFPAEAATLPVKRVILSSSGLAQIDREGSVEGNAEITLPVPLDQVDDILKSLSVFDSKGKVDSVRLAGKEPLAQEFRTLPFGPSDLESPDTLLAALRGAEVSVQGSHAMHGRIVSVASFDTKIGNNEAATRHRLTILTGEGLESIVLEEAQQIAFADPALQSKLDKVLAASLDSRAKDARSIAINLAGQGSRDVSLSYVVTAPIWKTSYRLLLPKSGDKAMLQGWAVLENMTGSDWDKVDLSIVSGNPVTYHQALYESYYVHRPDVPVQVFGRVQPRIDQGAASAGLEEVVVTAQRAAAPMLPVPPAPSAQALYRPRIAMGRQAAESAETGAQISFHFPQPVTVSAGQSLMVPFIGRNVPIERVWLYQPDVNANYPLSAVRIINDTDAGLPAGILTIFEGDRDEYSGDAQFPNLPHADSRLVSYALDQKTLIDRQESSDQLLAAITAEQGVIHVTRRAISDTAYTIKAPADGARTIILEQPKRQDFEPDDTKNLEVTPTHYRLHVSVSAGETKTVHLRLVHPLSEEIAVGNLSDTALDIWIGNAKSLGNRGAVEALTEVVKLRRAVADADKRIEDIDAHVERIGKDQDRLRSNLGQVPKDSDLAKQYLETMTAQEKELAGLAHDRTTAEQAQGIAKSKLNDQIAALKF